MSDNETVNGCACCGPLPAREPNTKGTSAQIYDDMRYDVIRKARELVVSLISGEVARIDLELVRKRIAVTNGRYSGAGIDPHRGPALAMDGWFEQELGKELLKIQAVLRQPRREPDP